MLLILLVSHVMLARIHLSQVIQDTFHVLRVLLVRTLMIVQHHVQPALQGTNALRLQNHLSDVEEDIIVAMVKQHARLVLQVEYALMAMELQLTVELDFMLILMPMYALSAQQDGGAHQVLVKSYVLQVNIHIKEVAHAQLVLKAITAQDLTPPLFFVLMATIQVLELHNVLYVLLVIVALK